MMYSESVKKVIIHKLIEAGLNAVNPAKLIAENVTLNGNTIQICNSSFSLNRVKRVFTLCIGKASLGMQYTFEKVLGKKITSSLVVTKNMHSDEYVVKAETQTGDHPIPEARSYDAGIKVMDFVKKVTFNDLVILGISGGASALIASPVSGLTLEDVKKTNMLLMASGASIQKINSIRKHLDILKGGGLVRIMYPAAVYSLIISDVIDNSISNIGSGLTTEDPSTFKDAILFLQELNLLDKIPPRVKDYLLDGVSGFKPETVKAGDSCLQHVRNAIIGSNKSAMDGVEKEARSLGLNTSLHSKPFSGSAKELGEKFANMVIENRKSSQDIRNQPSVTLIGGESTVIVKGKGKGGRNLEMGLAAVSILDGAKNVSMVCFATDGEDGITDAAGVMVDGQTAGQARQLGLEPKAFLRKNDSYSFFEKVGGMVKTGPTGTNVNDLVLLFSW